MRRKLFAIGLVVLFSVSAAMAAEPTTSSSNLTAAEIANKNVAARGGLQAWRAVQTLSWQGKMGVGGNKRATLPDPVPTKRGSQLPSDPRPTEEVQLPFVMDMQRPHKTRFELQFKGKTAVQVYDGTNGWKLRPFLNRNDVEPFTAEEVKAEAGRTGYIDGPLFDYAAKGTKVALEKAEPVDGHPAYKLKLTLKSGVVQHIWIDAQSFLDVKVQGIPRRMDGKMRDVYVYQRDFRSVDGLLVPFVLETAVDGYPATHKMAIEKVTVNPKLDDALFSKPGKA
jgi:hypothetical protein